MAWNPKKPVAIKKEITREFLTFIKEFNVDRVFKCFLCMPSTTAQDVVQARKLGIIDENTKIIAIERSKKWVRYVKTALCKAGYQQKNRQIIEKELIETTTDDFKEVMSKLGVDHIDLVYLDTCSCATQSLRTWIREVLNPLLSSDAVVSTNLLAARWVPILKEYSDNHVTKTLYQPINSYASQIANFWQEETNKSTWLTLGYKERGTHPPMVLCVSQNTTNISNNLRRMGAIRRVGEFSNLGYKN